MSIFGAINTSTSGLKVSQVATDVISNNISNAQNEHYTRQRVNVAQKPPITTTGGVIGTGAEVNEIIRVHNDFTFARFRNSSANFEASTFSNGVLEEISKYFPEIDEKGLLKDITNYFDAWQKLASNPSDSSQKIALAQRSINVSKNINDIRKRLTDMQDFLNEQIVSAVDEINRLAERISVINKEIHKIETTDYNHANTLRDERDRLELAIYKIATPTINKVGVKSFSEIDLNQADYAETYTMELGGFPLVDNSSFHPLEINASNGETGNLKSIFFKSQDHSLHDITDNITKGKLGAMLDLRGRNFNTTLDQPSDGQIQEYVDGLDVLSRTIIQQTNNIYAKSADTIMQSDTVGDTKALTSLEIDQILANVEDKLVGKVQKGIMKISTYDLNGKII
jgi:flagellar hook-associated protein 1 FlgK